MKTGIQLIDAERYRQISEEGFFAGHDDQYKNAEITDAATEYAIAASSQVRGCTGDLTPYINWPWDSKWWKPSDDPIRNLSKAGALIAAEIDRLQRLNN